MSTTTIAMGSFYDEKRATSELRKYREQGPIPSTRALIEALKAEGVEGATLLDIGGGIGAIQHELLDAGATRAICVDASAAYLDAAREEGRRHGHDGRVTYLHGDFVDLADLVGPPEIVTLDRVINVYPGWERLAGLAAGRAKRLFGLVYPRDTRVVRLIICRHESDAPSTEKAGARVLPSRRCDRADRPRERSHTSRRAGRRPRVEGRGLSPRMNQPRGVTKLPRGFRWKVSSRDDDQG